MAEKKKILYIVEAMGGGVFTYIVDGDGDIVLVLLADIGKLHRRSKAQLFFIHQLHQVGNQLIETDISLHLLDRHLVPLGHDLVGAFTCVLRVNLARSAGALVLDSFKLHFQGFGPLTGEDFFTLVQIILDHLGDGFIIRQVSDDGNVRAGHG